MNITSAGPPGGGTRCLQPTPTSQRLHFSDGTTEISEVNGSRLSCSHDCSRIVDKSETILWRIQIDRRTGIRRIRVSVRVKGHAV
jgi:hypothetical protein